jgi:catechol 2,3-dioxygenase
MGEQDYLYVRDPSGMRVEINAGGYRNYEPDWETVRYEPEQGSNVFYKNLNMPHSMFESFPDVPLDDTDAAKAREATGLFV